jgi:transposase
MRPIKSRGIPSVTNTVCPKLEVTVASAVIGIKENYPHVELLKQVKGVGTQIALTYVLTLDDPHRFPKSREVGWDCALGAGTPVRANHR